MMQYAILVYALLSLVATYLFQPETSQPGARGVERIVAPGERVSWVWLNPLERLTLLRSPNVLLLVSHSPVYGDMYSQ